MSNAQAATDLSARVDVLEDSFRRDQARYYELRDSVESTMRNEAIANQLAKDLSGYSDVRGCADGSVLSCVMLIPAAKLAKARKIAKALRARRLTAGEELIAARRTDDLFEDVTGCVYGGFNSFTGSTRVLMADGTTRPIESIQVGDWVMAADEHTGDDPQPRRVTRVWKHQDSFVLLHTSAGTITTTNDHPFYNATTGTFTNAGDLPWGTALRTADHTPLTTRGTQPANTTQDAYNLTVQGRHTYYVTVGTTTALVHNTSCNQINKAIERGQAPKGITRADKGNPNIPGNQDHIHFDDFGGTLNRDGTWGHDGPGSPTKSQLDWLREHGWDV